MDEYVLNWKWKKREYRPLDRFISKGVDLAIVAILCKCLFLLISQTSIEITKTVLLIVVSSVYFMYQIINYRLTGTTLGRRMFHIEFIKRFDHFTSLSFIGRTLFHLIIFIICFKLGLLFVLIIYYLVKGFDAYSGPIWDYHIKLRQTLMPAYKALYIGSIAFICISFLTIGYYSDTFQQLKHENTINSLLVDIGKFMGSLFDSETSSAQSALGKQITDAYSEDDYVRVISLAEAQLKEGALDDWSLNTYGLALISTDRAQDAIDVYTDMIASESNLISDVLWESIYNNLGWAYNESGDYERAVENLEKAISLGDRSHYVFSNLGNSYLNLENYDSAIENYKKALQKTDCGDFVLMDLGVCYYELEDYENALIYFSKYEKLYPEDFDTLWYLGWSSGLYSENYLDGIDYFDSLITTNPDSTYAIYLKLDYLNSFEAYDETLAISKTFAPHLFSDDEYITEEVMFAYKNLEQYELGLDFAKKFVTYDTQNINLWYGLLDFYYMNERYDESKAFIDDLSTYLDNSYENRMEVAYLYEYNYYYSDAIAILETIVSSKMQLALNLDQWEAALYELLECCYSSDYFDHVIQLCDKYQGKVRQINLNYYKGKSLFEIGEVEASLNTLQKALKVGESLSIYENILYAQIYEGQLMEALLTLNHAKALGLDDSSYQEYFDMINDQLDLTPGQQIFKFIHKNYMYKDQLHVAELENELIQKDQLYTPDYEKINNQVFKDDYFSFVLYEDWFDEYITYENSISVTSKLIDDETLYTKIDFFGALTDTEFQRIVNHVNNPEHMTLILDLRENFGGDTESAFNILDYLIGTTYLGSWESPDGEDYDYYSDGNQIQFKQIYILVDDQSASSSEIVALGLHEFLPNSTIIGETTFGKGVGQLGMLNLKDKFALFVVNANWSINHINIHKKGITPDIELMDGTLDDYLNKISLHSTTNPSTRVNRSE